MAAPPPPPPPPAHLPTFPSLRPSLALAGRMGRKESAKIMALNLAKTRVCRRRPPRCDGCPSIRSTVDGAEEAHEIRLPFSASLSSFPRSPTHLSVRPSILCAISFSFTPLNFVCPKIAFESSEATSRGGGPSDPLCYICCPLSPLLSSLFRSIPGLGG